MCKGQSAPDPSPSTTCCRVLPEVNKWWHHRVLLRARQCSQPTTRTGMATWIPESCHATKPCVCRARQHTRSREPARSRSTRAGHSGWMLHNVTSVFVELCHSDPDCKSVETQCWLRPKGQYQNHLLIFHRHSFLSRAISSLVESIVATTPSWQCAPPLSATFGS